MGLGDWLGHNWFTVLQSIGIVGGLLFTACSLRLDAKVRRTGNLISLTGQHREVWRELYRAPQLSRVLHAVVPSPKHPVTCEEELFVRLLVLHFASAFRAMKEGLYVQPEGLRMDIDWFFSLPIPREVWNRLKAFQDRDVLLRQACVSVGAGRA